MKRTLLAMIATLAMAACTKQPVALENTEWKLIELKGASNELFAAEPDTFFFTLSTENGLNGVGACNSFFGNYQLSTDFSIMLQPMGMTQMACKDMALEDEFIKMLYEVSSYSIEGNRLTLFNEGTKVAELEAVTTEK